MSKKGILVGLTGQTGAGKTLAGSILARNGYSVIDADAVARNVVGNGGKCLLELALEFGVDIISLDGALNRQKLGDIVFSDSAKRKKLNEITFPYIQEEIFGEVERLRAGGAEIVFLDAPTLIESGTHKFCDLVISVVAPAEERLERIIARDKITRGQAVNRMNSQHNDDFYTSKSDYVICNDADLLKLNDRLAEILGEISPGKKAMETI